MLRLIFYAVVALLALSFFGITIQSIIDSPAGQANFDYVGDLIESGWDFIVSYLEDVVDWFRDLI